MPATEPIGVDENADLAASAPERRRSARVRVWTRKPHNYLGLYLLLFLWLFSGSGLVLSHSTWSVARFWEARQESRRNGRFARPLRPGTTRWSRTRQRAPA